MGNDHFCKTSKCKTMKNRLIESYSFVNCYLNTKGIASPLFLHVFSARVRLYSNSTVPKHDGTDLYRGRVKPAQALPVF